MSIPRLEDQLVICAARPSLNAASEEQIDDLLRQELNWLDLLISANRHGVVPLLEKNLAHREVPPEIATELRNWKQEIFTFNLFLIGELIKLLDLFAEHGIHVLAFKGPALTLQTHGDIGLRQYKDLDLLVRKKDVGKTSQLLLDAGFKVTPDVSRAQQAASLRFGSALTFTDLRNVIVDLHWNVAERHLGIEIPTEDFWPRAEQVNIGGRTFLTLSAEDMLLILCCHGYAHSWERLAWICDVGMLVERRTDLDWSYVFDRARRAGVLRIFLEGLSLARGLLNVTLPAEANRQLAHDEVVKTDTGTITAALFQPADYARELGSLSRHMRMRERTRDRLRGFLAMFAVPREYDWMFVSAPVPVYYLVRPLRWAATRLRIQREPAQDSPS